MGTVLLTGDHAGELEPVPYQVPQLSDISGRDKRGLDHAAHIQVTDPFGVFPVSFVSLLRLCIFGMGKSNPNVIFFPGY